MTILVTRVRQITADLAGALPAHRVVPDLQTAAETPDDLVVIGADQDLQSALDFSIRTRVGDPARGVILVRDEIGTDVMVAALQAGMRQVVRTGDGIALAAAAHASLTLSEQLRNLPAGGRNAHPATVVTVFGSKGGCGKTTVATNLALAIATTGERTCIVDLDLAFGDVAIVLGLVPEHTIADAIPMASTLDHEGTASLLTAHPSGLHALLAPIDPAVAEQISAELVGRILTRLREMYDVIVVDSPPAFSEQILAALDVADDLVLLATPDAPSVKNLRLALRTLDQLGSESARTIVLNRADAQVGMTPAQVQKLLGAEIDVTIPAHRAVPISINNATPIVLGQSNHPVSKAIRGLAGTVRGRARQQPTGRAARHLFRRKVATA